MYLSISNTSIEINGLDLIILIVVTIYEKYDSIPRMMEISKLFHLHLEDMGPRLLSSQFTVQFEEGRTCKLRTNKT